MAEANFLSRASAVDFFVELSEEELLDFPPMMDVRRRLRRGLRRLLSRAEWEASGDPHFSMSLTMSQNRLSRLIEDRGRHAHLGCVLAPDRCVGAEGNRSHTGAESQAGGEIKPLVERHLRRGADAPEKSARGSAESSPRRPVRCRRCSRRRSLRGRPTGWSRSPCSIRSSRLHETRDDSTVGTHRGPTGACSGKSRSRRGGNSSTF